MPPQPILISVALGLLLGFTVQVLARNANLRRTLSMVAGISTLFVWLAYVGLIIWWHYRVERHLDGSEGSGVGFGSALVHLGGLLVAVFVTSMAVGVVCTWLHKKNLVEQGAASDR